MKLPVINQQDAEHANRKLSHYYEQGLIPPEKKAYLTDLKSSHGPWMGIEANESTVPHYMLDAASQIATLGQGFNHSSFFGIAHYLESWLNRHDTPEFQSLRTAYHNFLKRQLGWEQLNTIICHSGAEANEIALGFCYRQRKNPGANKVLAFEGSFHGRMLVSLSSTWNKAKREPFEWDEYKSIFCPIGEIPDDQFNLASPAGWEELWDNAPALNFQIDDSWANDPVLKSEVDSLLQVRQQLVSGKIFAVIVEPMQCEGGDRYTSDRWHRALLIMARSFEVPVIYDEVQVGFHLGREFFWHRQFELKDAADRELRPDFIVCAKKAQTGLIISEHDLGEHAEEFQVASLVRGYIHAVGMDQSHERILSIEKKAKEQLKQLIDKFSDHLECPRATGISFAFDFKDKSHITRFIEKRFDHGLLYYPAGDKTLRFRLNTAFRDEDISFLFNELTQLCSAIFLGTDQKLPQAHERTCKNMQRLYQWHETILRAKLELLQGRTLKVSNIKEEIENLIVLPAKHQLVFLTHQNFAQYNDKIQDLQKRAYEPARQTKPESFERALKDTHGLAMGIEFEDKLMGLVVAAPLKNFPYERGVLKDPEFHNEDVLYMIDTTIGPKLQGRGLGHDLKQALTLWAMAEGRQAIHGRNRDKMAGAMLTINLGLGAREIDYVKDDYLDDNPYRDVFYYAADLQWKMPEMNLSDAISSPLGIDDLNDEFLKDQLPFMVNKVCLSNFVSERFLRHMEKILRTAPQGLQHGYSTSGQSECVDKIVKSIWYQDKKGKTLLTFDGHYFGEGSFLSRSLSNSNESFFPVTRLGRPHHDNVEELLARIETILKTGNVLGIWLEPLLQQSMEKVPLEFLIELTHLKDTYKVPLIFNETASSLYRYDHNSHLAAGIKGVGPDAVMQYLGGQAGIVYINSKYFLDKPLMLISTWDGDEASFSNYTRALAMIKENKSQYILTQKEFTEELTHFLHDYNVTDVEIENATGSFKGDLPYSWQSRFKKSQGRFIVNPSWSAMKRFLKSRGRS